MVSFITVYTDASVDSEKELAGLGCWIKYGNNQTIKHSGIIRNGTKCSTTAELMAIANAIFVTKQKVKYNDAILVVVTDSQNAINYIKTKHDKRMDWMEIADLIRNSTPPGWKLCVKKVKAHSYHDGARSYINNVVDGLARNKLFEARANA